VGQTAFLRMSPFGGKTDIGQPSEMCAYDFSLRFVLVAH
jgi:hypothetical protein